MLHNIKFNTNHIFNIFLTSYIFHLYIDPENYQRFVVGKIINLELKINSMHRQQKLIFEKVSSVNFKEDEEENIDIFQDLPLKNQNDVQAMEIKLLDDKIYRSQMVS